MAHDADLDKLPDASLSSPRDTVSGHQRLVLALDAASIGTWEWNLRTGVVHWSSTIEQLHGFEAGAFGSTFDVYKSYIHERDRPEVLEAIHRAINETGSYASEYRMHSPDGSLHWIAACGRVERESDGSAGQMVSVCLDATARKQKERELALQRTVARTVSSLAGLDEIGSELLQTLCENLGWDLGELWLVGPGSDQMQLLKVWSHDPELGVLFRSRTEQINFAKGHGFPGRVWQEGQTLWERDVASDLSMPRSSVVAELGLHAAVGFPISFGGNVLGAFVFYARHVEDRDEDLTRLLSFIGFQVGQYLERRNALDKLQASEDRYRGLAESASDAILTVDPNGKIIFVNSAAERIFGYTRLEILAMSLSSLMPERFREGHRAGFARFVSTGEKRIPWTGIELPGLRKDGTEIPLEIAFSEFTSRGQRFVTGVARDIGKRKREADALQFVSAASKAFAETLDTSKTLEALADLAVPRIADWCMVDLLNERGTFDRVMTRHRDPEMIRRATELNQLFPSWIESEFGPAHVLRTGAPDLARVDQGSLRAAGKNGEFYDALKSLGILFCLCLPLFARGRNLGAITLAISESGRVYDEFDVRVGEELAARVSVSLDNARLYSNAQEASRVRDEFLAQLSHELKTPLTSVLGYASLLEQGGLSAEELRMAIEAIKQSGQAQARLVEDILDISRAVMGKFRLEVAPIELGEVVDNAVDAVRPAAKAKNITLTTAAKCEGGCHVVGDPSRLQQVAWNLLSNAIKFTPVGGKVSVAVSQTASTVSLEVTDNGAGIAAEFLPRMFDRFSQGRGAHELGGLGLGLSIVRSLIELHGGTISARSEGLGKGSTFRVELPALHAEETRELFRFSTS